MNEKAEERCRLRRGCAVCSSTKRRLLFQQTFAQMLSGSLLPGYDVVVCEECGFGYADCIPDQAAFDAYYRHMSKYEYQDSEREQSEYDLVRFEAIASVLKRFLPDLQTRVLEIGCATGGLLSLLKNSGYRQVLGLDPSPACAEAAQRLHGIRVLPGALSETSFAGSSFDCLVLNGVLEHIRDLRSSLGQMWHLLTAEGLVYVEVPDATRFQCWLDAAYQQFSTEHINFFSRLSLYNLMRASGFAEAFCERDARKQSHCSVMPVISAVFRKDTPRYWQGTRDSETEQALAEYIRRSREFDEGIQQILEELALSGRPIIVWGVGTHTLRLMATSRLRQANIAAFVDSNPRYQGKQLDGVPIIAPADLQGRAEAILISSRVFQQEIVRQVRDDLKCSNELVLLYPM